METTRHFVATVYIVNGGKTALHEHEKLDMWLPPGGHIDRDELPHEAAQREVLEETGFEVDLVAPEGNLDSATATSIPQPQEFLLEDINVHGSEVGHQHIDFIFFGAVDGQSIEPASGETEASAWQWFGQDELRGDERFAEDVRKLGQRAIETVEP
jgi:8-oxo-dGTP pyrophosphatase MutT (NUDIX family)